VEAELAERGSENKPVVAFPPALGAARRAVGLFFSELGRLLGDDRLLKAAQEFPGFGQR
jgi:hypothetical protein